MEKPLLYRPKFQVVIPRKVRKRCQASRLEKIRFR